MDPVYLRASELEYELSIRGAIDFPNPRRKTQHLRECLKRELYIEILVRPDLVAHLVPRSELVVCGQIADEITALVTDGNVGEERSGECRSRLLHVVDRVNRLSLVEKAEQVIAGDIVQVAEGLLAELERPPPRTHKRNPVASATTESPLADIIETIQVNRQSPRSSHNISGGATCNPFVRGEVPDTVQDDLALPPARFSDRFGTPARVFDRPYDASQSIRMGMSRSDLSGRVLDTGHPQMLEVGNDSRSAYEAHRRPPLVTDQPPPRGLSRDAPDFCGEHYATRPLASQYYQHNREADPPRPLASAHDQRNRGAVPPRPLPSAYDPRDTEPPRPFASAYDHRYRGAEPPRPLASEYDDRYRGAEPPRPLASEYDHRYREVEGPSPRRHDQSFQFEHEYNQHRDHAPVSQRFQQRRTVPVHQWKLSFSGDGNGTHLYDFLAELRMFQRSEGVLDEELFASIVHLLTGRARL